MEPIRYESRYLGDGMANMKQHQVEEGDRAVARRLFMALCELHPDRYITLIEPRDANDRTPSLSMRAVEAEGLRSSRAPKPLAR
jgi:hypothetical protein